MKLLVIGATRGTGRRLLEQAFEEGQGVTVLMRFLSRLKFHHKTSPPSKGISSIRRASRAHLRGMMPYVSL